MRETVQALTKEGLRDGRKIMIGGGQVDDEIQAFTVPMRSASTPCPRSPCARTG